MKKRTLFPAFSPLVGRARIVDRRVVPLMIGSLLLALLPLGAQGQESSRAGAIAALEAGQRVRLQVEQLGRVEGRFLMADEEAMTFAEGEPIGLPDINRLWVRRRSTGKGARIGALVGGAVGIVFGIWMAREVSHCDAYEPEPCIPTAAGAALGGVVFGAGGTVLGAGIGFAIPTWRLRFP